MQFIPSTWSVVGVDGDNDGKRNPQDIDDAALATAVYLCSGNEDLSTETGRRPAIFRYNHSHHYVDLVLSLMDAYLDGDYTSVPNVTAGYAGTFVAVPAPVPGAARAADRPSARSWSAPRATSSPSWSTRPAPRPGPTAAARARSTPRS